MDSVTVREEVVKNWVVNLWQNSEDDNETAKSRVELCYLACLHEREYDTKNTITRR